MWVEKNHVYVWTWRRYKQREQRRQIRTACSSRWRKQRGSESMDIYWGMKMFSWLRRKCSRVLLGLRLSMDGENRNVIESQTVTLKNAALSCMFVHLVSGVSEWRTWEERGGDKTQTLPLILLKTNYSSVNILSYCHQKWRLCVCVCVAQQLFYSSCFSLISQSRHSKRRKAEKESNWRKSKQKMERGGTKERGMNEERNKDWV